MIKKTFLSGVLAIALLWGSAQANEPSYASVTYTGQSEETLSLSSLKYRIEYHDVPVQTTCYRQEFMGYRWQCWMTPNGQVCRQVPVYRTVAYPCTVIEKQAIKVADANVSAVVTLRFGTFPSNLVPNEVFTVKLDEDRLEVSTSGSKNVLVIKGSGANSYDRVEMGAIDQINMMSNMPMSFLAAEPYAQAFDMGFSGVSVVNGKVTFKASSLMSELALPLHLTVVRRRDFASDYLVYERVLKFDSFVKAPQNDGTVQFSASYKELGIPALGEGKYLFTFTSDINRAVSGLGTLINASSIDSDLSAKSQMLLKIK